MSILLLNQSQLTDPKVKDILSAVNSKDLEFLNYFQMFYNKHNLSGMTGLVPRCGVNNLPFKNHSIDQLNCKMPVYRADFNLSWQEISDRRACEIEQQISIKNKSLVVFWSGGIDSTNIVVAILKNFKKINLGQVLIALNWASVVENPNFYQNHIIKNFTCVDVDIITKKIVNHDQYLAVGGTCGDMLHQGCIPNIEQTMSVSDSHLFSRSWQQDPDKLINYFSLLTKNKKFATLYYEKISENILSVDIPIKTYFDFIWWAGFNYEWHSQFILQWLHWSRLMGLSWQAHQEKFCGWYTTEDYQLWAMTSNISGIKFGAGAADLKQTPKNYIYEYTQDQWYKNYKTKLMSRSRRVPTDPLGTVFAITDTFDSVYIDDCNLDQIKQDLIKFLN